MRTLILALTAAAALGLAAPAFASDGGARGAAIEKQAQDFSSSHRHHWRRHHWRHHYGWHRHCFNVWRYGRLVTVCR